MIVVGQGVPEEVNTMPAATRYHVIAFLLLSSLTPKVSAADAGPPEPDVNTDGPRTELWLALSSWPAIAGLQPAAGGSFESIGYGLGAAAHWPVRSFERSTVLVGIEGAIMVNESDVPVYFDDLLSRDGYVAVSAKWRLGDRRNFSLDAGLGYHLLDIAQLATNYFVPIEFQSWEESAFGPFVGATWDVGAGKPGGSSGLSLGLRLHFLDFGTVRDEAVLFDTVLGGDAGELAGPLVALQIGYRWR
jgi:hypothetical protein